MARKQRLVDRELREALKEHGFDFVRCKSGHYIYRCAQNGGLLVIAGTPGDRVRNKKHVLAKIKRVKEGRKGAA